MKFKNFTKLLGIFLVIFTFVISLLLFIETVTEIKTPISELIIDYEHTAPVLWPTVFRVIISLIGIGAVTILTINKIRGKVIS